MTGPVTWEVLIFVVVFAATVAGGTIGVVIYITRKFTEIFIQFALVATKKDLSETRTDIYARLDRQYNLQISRDADVQKKFNEIDVKLARAGINGKNGP